MSLYDKLAEKISGELNLDSDKQEIISYGAFAFFQILLSIFLVIVFGALFGILWEALIFSFAASILRKYSGGVHASSAGVCLIIGTVVTIGCAYGLSLLSVFFTVWGVVVFSAISFSFCFFIIYKYAPVDSEAKPIQTAAKRARLKKGSLWLLFFYFVIACVLIVCFYITESPTCLTYCACIRCV